MQPLVSIVIPAYNAENCIENCIKSVLAQTYQNLEVICVNDGSKDKTKEILDGLAQEDARLKVIHNENRGVSATRNCGIKNATGEFVQFVDSDDSLYPLATEHLMSGMKEGADWVLMGYHRSDGIDMHVPMQGMFSSKEFVEKFMKMYLGGVFNQPWNKLYRRDKIREYFDTDMSIAEDAVFNIRYLKGIEKICLVDEIGYDYVVDNPNSLSWRYNAKALESERRKIMELKELMQCYACTENIKELDVEFEKDFLRCINNMLYASGDSAKVLITKISDWIKDDIWSAVLLANRNQKAFDKKKVNLGVQWFVRKGLIRKWLLSIIQKVKGA